MRFRSVLAAALLSSALALNACGERGDGGRPVTAVATTPHVADIVRNVGGGRVEVGTLVEGQAEPHDYEPRPSDAEALARADLIVRSGGEIDSWLGDLLDSSGADAETLTLADTVRSPRKDDPHWWQDPLNVIAATKAVRDALVQADPAGRPGYERRARGYTARLRRLDAAVAACMRRVPAAQRKLVTTHDALGYFADRYGLELIGALIPGRSAQAQPSAGETDALVRQIERERVRAIFPESSLNSKLERAVAEETGARVGRALFTDTLASPGRRGDTYIEATEANADAIAAGLSRGSVRCAGPAS